MLKLGVNVGYSGRQIELPIEQIREAEAMGCDSVWTAEAYGSDALTPLAWIGAATSRIKLATGIMQLSARTPAATAMAAIATKTTKSSATTFANDLDTVNLIAIATVATAITRITAAATNAATTATKNGRGGGRLARAAAIAAKNAPTTAALRLTKWRRPTNERG